MIKGVIGLGFIGASIFAASFFLPLQKDNNDAAAESLQNNDSNAQATPISQPAGRIAYTDPETGALSSTPSVGSQPRANIGTSVTLPPVEMVRHANGMVQAKLNGRFQMPVVATIGCDGKIDTEHTEGLSENIQECEAE